VTFVPSDFEPPLALVTPQFVLEPLGPEHNESDYAAWTSSVEHIRATPGFAARRWPRSMSLEENRADLERHARDFADRSGFTYTVREPDGGPVAGCVYIYPADEGDHGASVRSWVRADRAELDVPLWRAVSSWLDSAWPFERVDYASRL
jgi:hypothetical protein